MKKQKRQRSHRFKSATSSRSSGPRIIEIEPKDVVTYILRAEEYVIPLIEVHKLPPADAFFLLAQHTRMLITGDSYPSVKSVVAMGNDMKALWQAGLYTPSPTYPYTFDATLKDEKKGLETERHYPKFFQPFSPAENDVPLGVAELAGGIVMHPETRLWQVWVMFGGPCVFFCAFRSPSTAQRYLGLILSSLRRGGTQIDAEKMYNEISSAGDGLPKQIPFDMMIYLMEHLKIYKIKL